MNDIEGLAREVECYITPEWAVDAILDVELMTDNILDPCCGTGVLARVAMDHGYRFILSIDKYDWGYGDGNMDFLDDPYEVDEDKNRTPLTVLMNPPFSKATQFVEKAFAIGARKIICFQRFAWWESEKRTEFWRQYPPNRIYVCAARATCWRVDLTPEQINKMGNTTTAHAWFVWEKGHPPGPLVSRLSKKKGQTDG